MSNHTGSDAGDNTAGAPERVPGHFDSGLTEEWIQEHPAGASQRPADWVHPYFAEMDPASVATMVKHFQTAETGQIPQFRALAPGRPLFGLWLLHLDGMSRRSAGMSLMQVMPWDFAACYDAGMHIGRTGENSLADSPYGARAAALFAMRQQRGEFEVGDQERYERISDAMDYLRGVGRYAPEGAVDADGPGADWDEDEDQDQDNAGGQR